MVIKLISYLFFSKDMSSTFNTIRTKNVYIVFMDDSTVQTIIKTVLTDDAINFANFDLRVSGSSSFSEGRLKALQSGEPNSLHISTTMERSAHFLKIYHKIPKFTRKFAKNHRFRFYQNFSFPNFS